LEGLGVKSCSASNFVNLRIERCKNLGVIKGGNKPLFNVFDIIVDALLRRLFLAVGANHLIL